MWPPPHKLRSSWFFSFQACSSMKFINVYGRLGEDFFFQINFFLELSTFMTRSIGGSGFYFFLTSGIINKQVIPSLISLSACLSVCSAPFRFRLKGWRVGSSLNSTGRNNRWFPTAMASISHGKYDRRKEDATCIDTVTDVEYRCSTRTITRNRVFFSSQVWRSPRNQCDSRPNEQTYPI